MSLLSPLRQLATFYQSAAASALILGLAVGIPYYGLPYFYDYFEQTLAEGGQGWSRQSILLGLPLGTLVTLFAAPMLAHRMRPKTGVMAGALLCSLAISALGLCEGSLPVYYLCWLLYMFGWTFAGPMAHQVLLSKVYGPRFGEGLAFAFFGLSLFGAFSVAAIARPLTTAFGYRNALLLTGAVMLLAIPVTWKTLPDADDQPVTHPPKTWRSLLPTGMPGAFWLLIIGSSLTAAAIACINQHLKLILRERGLVDQAKLDEIYGWTVLLLLTCSSLGRFFFAWAARHFPRRAVLTVAMLLLLSAIPLLYFVSPTNPPYLFAILFGLGMSSDSLLVNILAADSFGSANLARPMSFLVPFNTVAQTWFPYVATFLWSMWGNYNLAIAFVFLFVLVGRTLLAKAAPARPKHSHA